MNRKYSVFLWLILALGSCNKTNGPGTPAGVDVYLIGGAITNGGRPETFGRYWKNNEPFDLPISTVSDLGVQETTTGVAMAGNDLYISGEGTGPRNAQGWLNSIAKYWKNGVSINLTDGSTIAYTTAIGVAGSDVYVTGLDSEKDSAVVFGKYWKNGVGVNLPDYFSPTGIAISGKDVYISGLIYSQTGHSIAAYCKNDIPVSLSDGSSDAKANAITINGSDIYVAGYDGNRAVYWKNQVPVYLTDGSYTATLQSISVEGTNVLVAGRIGTTGTYWKNGTPVTVGDNIGLYGIAVAGDSTYVLGAIGRNPIPPNYNPRPSYTGYWINNSLQMLFDSTSNSGAWQILVIKH